MNDTVKYFTSYKEKITAVCQKESQIVKRYKKYLQIKLDCTFS